MLLRRAVVLLCGVVRAPQAEGCGSWLLDVRSNPGGIVGEGLRVAELLAPPGEIFALVRDRSGTEQAERLSVSRTRTDTRYMHRHMCGALGHWRCLIVCTSSLILLHPSYSSLPVDLLVRPRSDTPDAPLPSPPLASPLPLPPLPSPRLSSPPLVYAPGQDTARPLVEGQPLVSAAVPQSRVGLGQGAGRGGTG
jgi:hypothetical protein